MKNKLSQLAKMVLINIISVLLALSLPVALITLLYIFLTSQYMIARYTSTDFGTFWMTCMLCVVIFGFSSWCSISLFKFLESILNQYVKKNDTYENLNQSR
jgi:hypothetical protein